MQTVVVTSVTRPGWRVRDDEFAPGVVDEVFGLVREEKPFELFDERVAPECRGRGEQVVVRAVRARDEDRVFGGETCRIANEIVTNAVSRSTTA